MALGHDASKDGIYLVIDERNARGGITDRLKVAVGLCYLAQQSGVGFKLIHTAGFDLRDYLLPNEVDWSAEKSDITLVPWRRRELRHFPPQTQFPDFKPGLQYVCRKYVGRNLLEQQKVPNWEQRWRELFWKLFAPSELVRDALQHNGLPERYAVVNARFINALGMFEPASYNSPLPGDEQRRLIDAVLEKVDWCSRDAGVPAIVYSDSAKFLQAAAQSGFATCNPASIGHIMDSGIGDPAILGTFTNFFEMSQAEKVYSIRSVEGFPENCLYRTQYPHYAAIVGDRPFIKVE